MPLSKVNRIRIVVETQIALIFRMQTSNKNSQNNNTNCVRQLIQIYVSDCECWGGGGGGGGGWPRHWLYSQQYRRRSISSDNNPVQSIIRSPYSRLFADHDWWLDGWMDWGWREGLSISGVCCVEEIFQISTIHSLQSILISRLSIQLLFETPCSVLIFLSHKDNSEKTRRESWPFLLPLLPRLLLFTWQKFHSLLNAKNLHFLTVTKWDVWIYPLK